MSLAIVTLLGPGNRQSAHVLLIRAARCTRTDLTIACDTEGLPIRALKATWQGTACVLLVLSAHAVHEWQHLTGMVVPRLFRTDEWRWHIRCVLQCCLLLVSPSNLCRIHILLLPISTLCMHHLMLCAGVGWPMAARLIMTVIAMYFYAIISCSDPCFQKGLWWPAGLSTPNC